MPEAENPAEEFELKLSGDGINIDKKIDRQTAAEVMAAVLGVRAAPIGSGQTHNARSPNESEEQMSLREFLDEVKAIRKPDQIVAIGHYICHQEGQSNFSRDDVKTRFSTAKEPMPANFARDFGLAMKAGMVAEAHQQAGRFYVTKTGIQAIERHFSKESKK